MEVTFNFEKLVCATQEHDHSLRVDSCLCR